MASSKEFLIEDDDAAHVSYLPQDAWQSWNGSNYHANSYHVTKVPGAVVTFVFNGTYVAYYSDRNYNHAEYTVLLDGESVFNGTSLSPSLARQELLFSKSVPQGTHTLIIRNAGDPGPMGVDYFVYHALLATPPSSSEYTPNAIPATTPAQAVSTRTADSPSPTIPAQAESASTADPPQSPLPTSYPAHPTVGTGAIVGSALAGGALLLLLIGVAVLVARRRRDRDGRALVEAQPVPLPAPLPPPYSESSALSPSLPRGKVERATFYSE